MKSILFISTCALVAYISYAGVVPIVKPLPLIPELVFCPNPNSTVATGESCPEKGCQNNDICCPTQTGGTFCFNAKKSSDSLKDFVFDKRCPEGGMSTGVYEECVSNGCKDNLTCCPKPSGGSWCIDLGKQ